jgi:hypothetical protein
MEPSGDVLRTAADVEAALDPSVVLLYAEERPLLHDATIRKERRRRPLCALVLSSDASLERILRLANARLARPPRRPAAASSRGVSVCRVALAAPRAA